MRTTLILCLLTLTTALTACSGLPRIVATDPRCQPRQYCPYTDPPSPIRTEALRYDRPQSNYIPYSGSVRIDPAVR